MAMVMLQNLAAQIRRHEIFLRLAKQYIIPATATPDPARLRLAFDIESDGFAATKIHCIVVGDLDSGHISEFGPDQIEAALARLSEADYLIGHNICGFDLPLLERLHGWTPKPGCRLVDTLIASRLVLANIGDLDDQAAAMGDPKMGKLHGRHSLEAWGIRLGLAKVGIELEDFSQWSLELQERCVSDVSITIELWCFLQPDGQPPAALELEHRVSRICAEITTAGIPFDRGAGEQLAQMWADRIAVLRAQLLEQFPSLENPNSRTQVGELLEARGWIPASRTEKTGQPTLDDEAMESIGQQFPELAGLAEFFILNRRLGQLKNGDKAWLKCVDDAGRVHGSLVHIGTPHHRAAHYDPNLAQVPNPKKGKPLAAECRSLFHTDGDWTFVTCDQAGLQDRAFAHYLAGFDGGAYAKAFVNGLDPHWAVVKALGLVPTGTARDKENKLHAALREGCKSFRYGFLFGAQPRRLGLITLATLRSAAVVAPVAGGALLQQFFPNTDDNTIRGMGTTALARFEAATPGLRELRNALDRQAKKNNWLLGLDGRRIPTKANYTLLNYAVTSAEAIICKRWLVDVHDELHDRFRYGWDGDVVLVAWTHDELAACCHKEIATEVGEIMVRHAKAAGENFNFKVPLASDRAIGNSWGGAPEKAAAKTVATVNATETVAPELALESASPISPAETPDSASLNKHCDEPASSAPLSASGEGGSPPPSPPTIPPTPLPPGGLPSVAAKYLADVFGPRTTAPVFVAALANNKEEKRKYPPRDDVSRNIAALEGFVAKWDVPGRAIYYCVSTIKPGLRRRAKDNLAELTGLHIDIDFKTATAAPDGILSVLDKLPLPPTIVNHSGHGFHCYWLFKTAITANDTNKERVEAALRRLADILAGDYLCCEVAHLMRLPGSHNSKDPDAVVTVTNLVTRIDDYSLEELEAWLAKAKPILARKDAPEGTPGASVDASGTPTDDPWESVAAAQTFKPPIDVEARLAAMAFQGPGDSGVHQTQLQVTASLLNYGTPLEDVVNFVLEATQTAVGDAGQNWDWQHEEHELRGMCKTWLEKHPEIGTGEDAAEGMYEDSGGTSTTKPANPTPRTDVLQSVRASQVQIVAIEWLWPDRFAVGKLGIIAGLPDEGKGQILADIAARVTNHLEWPCKEGIAPQGNVVLLTAEDDESDTVVPRLMAAGADLDRVEIAKMVATQRGEKRMFSLLTDLPLLRQKIAEVGDVKVVLIDPVTAYLGHGKIDSFRTTDVRAVLAPLVDLATQTRTAVIGIMHFNKKTDVTNALLRISDSLAFGATARHVYAVVKDDENDRTLFVKGKNNNAPRDQKALAYSFGVRDVGIDPKTEAVIQAPHIIWHPQHVDVTAAEAMSAVTENKSPAARDAAKKFLTEMLATGPVKKSDIEDAAEANCISPTTLRRAKDDLGVEAIKDGRGPWLWKLPWTSSGAKA
jgi:DNA polymerase I-like protein with 3'-5' exonuclease and polymerase domains